MQKRLNWMLLMLLIALVAFAGCSDDDETAGATTSTHTAVTLPNR